MLSFDYSIQSLGTAAVIYLGFWTWVFVLSYCIPGQKCMGLPINGNSKLRLTYTLNGLYVTLVTWFTYLIFSDFGIGMFPATIVYDNYVSICILAVLFSILVSLCLYCTAPGLKPSLSLTKNFFYHFWCGLELNPSFYGLDLKLSFLNGALNGWVIINFSFMAKQLQLHNMIGQRMLIYFIFSFIYSLDYYYFESMILSTWDITDEHLGFMLIFGYLWWMWFAFAIQPFYLIHNLTNISYILLIPLLAMFLFGYYLFRTSNLQKNNFKISSSTPIWGAPPRTVANKILISGWWGVVRKPNYLGDWIIAICLSLPCGFSSPIPYIYPAYLVILNLMRAQRDQKKCLKKYGDIWKQYNEIVPYLVIPYIY